MVAGNTLTYNLTVTNSGPDTATNVQVADTLPGGVTLVSATPSQGTCAGAVCNLGSMANGGNVTIIVVAAVNPGATGPLVNSATVSATETDPAPGNNTATASTNLAPILSINDVTVTEGNAGTVQAIFTVSLSAASSQVVTVDYATANGTATAGSDYVSIGVTTLTFPIGVTSQPVIVTVNGDTAVEGNETFFVNLSNPASATIADGQGIGTIINDDVSLSINDVTVTEGNAGTVQAIFTVSLSAASSQVVTVNYATADGSTNPATAGSDYLSTNGTLTFPIGVTSQPVTVTVNGDTAVESNETFFVNLSSPANATISDGQGIGTIIDDESISLNINDVTVTEGNAGTVQAIFTVSLSTASALVVTVDYATADDTATAGSDYVSLGVTTLTFPIGVTSQPITVTVNGDLAVEGDETFFVNLSNPANATIADGQGVGTIIDDDIASLSINDVTVTEGNAGTVNAIFTVSLSAASSQVVTVDYATANDTATAGSDYLSTNGTLTFPIGVTSQPITVTVNGDTVVEGNETFFVNLSNPSNASISDGQGIGTILNDDIACSSSITLTATGDTSLQQITPDANQEGDINLSVAPDSSQAMHTLLQYNLGSITPGTTLCSASLLLSEKNVQPNQTIFVHRVTTGWSAATATWNSPWTTPGGDYISLAATSFAPDTTGLRSFNITSLAQYWVDNPAANFGSLLRSTTTGAAGLVQFRSLEDGTDPPRLVVVY